MRSSAMLIVIIAFALFMLAISLKGEDQPDWENTPPALSREASQGAVWDRCVAYVRSKFHDPDIQVIEVSLSVAYAHYFMADNPVWLFVLGPPGSGKTFLILGMLEALPNAHVLGSLTPRVFLSGFQNGKPESSLLLRLGSPLLLHKDFTTILSLRAETRAELIGQLREIWDGRFTRDCGNLDRSLSWTGKLTFIAACTGALERAWAVGRDMGERFMIIRWRTGDEVQIAIAANAQIGHEPEIKEELRRFAREFFAGAQPAAPLAEMPEPLVHLAKLVAQTRRTVERRENGEVVGVSDAEAPTRIAKAMAQVARAHASLFGRPEVGEEDLRIARRLGIDTIPGNRARIIDHVADTGATAYADLKQMTGLPISTISWLIDELDALGILEKNKSEDGAAWVRFTDSFAEQRRRAGLVREG